MIPRTYPSTVSGGVTKMVAYSLPSITGLKEWIDYIPVKTVSQNTALQNTYATAGYIVVDELLSITGKKAWVDYIPVYKDAAKTVPWSTNSNGFMPTFGLA